MSNYTGAGTSVHISAAAPATYDAAGFAALSWTLVGELETLPEINVTHTTTSFTNLTTAKTSIAKGAEEAITTNITCALDRDDAGQAMLTTARKSLTAIVSVKVTEGNGDIIYFRAMVLSERITGGAGVNDNKIGSFGFGVKPPATSGDTFIVVNAV